MRDNPKLSELAGASRMLERMTVLEAMRIVLEGTDWLVQSHSVRTDYRFAGFSLEGGSLLYQLECLADSITCIVVVNTESRTVVIIDNPRYGVPIAPDDSPALLDIPYYPPFPEGDDET